MNPTGTSVSEKLHLGEIVVIWVTERSPDHPGFGPIRGISPDRLPFRHSADISPATPISGFQGRNHGD
jgi:hypothetical protein